MVKRVRNKEKGRMGELFAMMYLILKGYGIIRRNFDHKMGEIDIIAKKGKTIVFIEVKARKDYFDWPITKTQQGRIMRSAQNYYLKYYGSRNYQMRHDVILINPWKWPMHFKNVWSE